jgi:hypothetical protein
MIGSGLRCGPRVYRRRRNEFGLGVKKADEKIVVKLTDEARIALSRMLSSRASVIRSPDRRSRFVVALREVAMLVNNLGGRSIGYEGEQQESHHARQRRMSAARYCLGLVSHVLSVLPQSAKIEGQLKHLGAALSNMRSAAR